MSKFLTFALLCMSTACSTAHAAPKPTPAADVPAPLVMQADSAVDRAALREALAQRRAANLARLHAYAEAGQFPRNTLSEGPLNVFVDGEGHICAAANLIHQDGFGALVQAQAKRDNYLVLSTVTEGPLMDWMLTSGFTQEEIALIQEPYMPLGLEGPAADPEVPEPLFAVAPVSIEEERERVRKVLLGVHTLLSANTKKSLGIALARVEGNTTLATSLTALPRFAVAPRAR